MWGREIINPRHACAARVTVVSVCVFVCSRSSCFSIRFIDTHGFLLGFSWILIHGFSKKPSVQTLWRDIISMDVYYIDYVFDCIQSLHRTAPRVMHFTLFSAIHSFSDNL